MVLPLKEVINSENFDTEIYNYLINSIHNFESPNGDIKNFLTNDAIDFEKRNISRTFLYYGEAGKLLGYFTLSMKNIINDSVPKNKIKKISGFSSDSNSIVVFLIGQLGRNFALSEHSFGDTLINTALNCIYNAQNFIGGRYCLIETDNSLDNEKVIEFYQNHGFSFLQENKMNSCVQMVAKL